MCMDSYRVMSFQVFLNDYVIFDVNLYGSTLYGVVWSFYVMFDIELYRPEQCKGI